MSEVLTGTSASRNPHALDALTVLGLLGGIALVWQQQVERPAGTFDLASLDLYNYFSPAYAYEARRLREWSIPLWNPHQGVGVPFLATLQPGALYPARLLLPFCDVPTAMRWSAIFHVGLMATGTYSLCRRLASSRGGALAAAIMATMTMALPWIFWPAFLESAAWMPLATLALVGIVRDGGGRWAILTGAVTGVAVLAGGYQIILYLGYALAILAVGLLIDRTPRVGVARVLVLGVCAALIAIGTGAPQLFTTLAWTNETLRQTTPLTDAQIQPLSILNWQYFQHMLITRVQPMQPFYMSLPVAVVASIGFVTRGRLGVTLGIGALATLLLACGPSTPFFVVYHWLPGFAMFRLPERLFMLFYFLTAIGLAFGTTWLGTLVRNRRWALAVDAICVGGTVWLLVAPFENRSALPWVTPPTAYEPLRQAVARARETIPGARLWIPVGTGSRALGLRVGMTDDALVFQDYEPLSSRRLFQYAYMASGLIPPPTRQLVEPFTGTMKPGSRIARPTLLDLAGIGGLVMRQGEPIPPHDPPYPRERLASGLTLVRNPAALPRAYVVPAARFVDNSVLALATISDPAFTGRDLAVVVGEPNGAVEQAVATADPAPFVPAQIATAAPEHVTVTVAPDRAALLVLVDAIAPGWRASVDGVPRRLLQTNFLVRGVVVQPGDQSVDFTYDAPGFQAGLILVSVTWTIVLALTVATLSRRLFKVYV